MSKPMVMTMKIRKNMPMNIAQAPAISVGNHSILQAVSASVGRNSATNSTLRQVYRSFLMIQSEKQTA